MLPLTLTEISPGWVRIVYGEPAKDGAPTERIEIQFQIQSPDSIRPLAAFQLAALDRARKLIVAEFQRLEVVLDNIR